MTTEPILPTPLSPPKRRYADRAVMLSVLTFGGAAASAFCSERVAEINQIDWLVAPLMPLLAFNLVGLVTGVTAIVGVFASVGLGIRLVLDETKALSASRMPKALE